MADENIVLKVGVDASGAETSVKSLKAQMRELKEVMGQHELGSAAFTEAAKKAGELQDKMADIKDAVGAFNPVKKFQAFAGVLGGVANGFSAAQGAMGLFGGENKNMEAAILKTQSAMALANGVNGLLGMKDQLGILGSVIKDGAVKAFGSLKAAIISTGIGALAIALGVIIANWKEIAKVIEDTFPGFKKVEDFFKNIKQIGSGVMASIVESFKVVGDVVMKLFSGDFSGAINAAKDFGKRTSEAYNEAYQEADRKIKVEEGLADRKFKADLLEAQGKDVLRIRLKIAQDELTLLEKNSDEYNKKLIEIEKIRTEIRQKAEEERKKNLGWEEKARQRQIDEDIKFAEFEKSLSDQKIKDKQDEQAWLSKARQRQIDEDIKFAEFQMEIEKQKQDEKEKGYATASASLKTFSSALGESTNEGKAMAVAATTIDTWRGAIAALASGSKINPVLGFASMAAVIAAGVIGVQKILAVNVPKSSGGGGSAPNISAPSMANVSNTTNLTNGNEPILTRTLDVKNNKVFVVESDITNKQKTVKNIQNKATIK